MGKRFIVLVVLSFSLFASCVDKDEYQANVTVINHSDAEVKDFVLTLAGVPGRNEISVLEQGQQSELHITWIGRQSAFGGSIDSSYPFIEIEYYIGNKKYDVSSAEGVPPGDSGYTITDASKITVAIGNDGYKITDAK
jgi:hypothetical protein